MNIKRLLENNSFQNNAEKRKMQLQRLVQYSERQKNRSTYRHIDNLTVPSQQISYNEQEDDNSLLCSKTCNSINMKEISSYQDTILKLTSQLNLIKHNMLVYSKELLTAEQKRLEWELEAEEKIQDELLRHQKALQTHNTFIKEEYQRLKKETSKKVQS